MADIKILNNDIVSFEGNVGIGTDNPSAPLHIYQPSTTGLKLSRLNHDSVDLSLEGSNRFVISNVTDSTDLMSILYDSGNVGIGTTSPSNLLHIHASGNNASALIIEDDARRLQLGRDMIEARSADGSTVANLYIQPNGNTAFATTTGNVGIGTSGPGTKLDVVSNTQQLRLRRTDGADDDWRFYSWASGLNIFPQTQSTVFFGRDGATTDVNVYNGNLIVQDGNVGIGTTSPSEKLHVSGEVLFSSDGSRTTKLVSTDSSLEVQNGLSIFRGANTLGWLVNSDSNNNFGVYNWNRNGYVFVLKDGAIQNSITVTSTGIGLFDSTPSYGLDVNTAARVTGTLYSNGSLVGNSLSTGTISAAQPLIRGFYMQSNPETGQMMAHPYLMSDLASFVRRGGTVTITGLTSPPTNHDTLFRPDAGIWSTSASNYSGSTFTLELSNVNGVETLAYGTYCGIAFGNSGWAPASLKIEWSTDSGTTWTTALDSSAKSDSYYTRLNNGGSPITNIKFTIGQPSSSLRITNIFATDYDGKGSSRYHLSTDGGTVYGNVGIGAASPDAPLTVHSSTDPEIRFGYNSSQDHRILWDSSKVYIHADPENANGSSALGLAVDGVVRLYVNDSANVGIGTTTPNFRLDVEHNGNGTNGVQVTNTNTGTSARAVVELVSDSAQLDIYATGSNYSGVSGWNDAGVISTSTSSSNGLILNAQSTGITFQGGTTTRMFISTGGNVGIGTISPTHKLHVEGSVNITDDLTFGIGGFLGTSSSVFEMYSLGDIIYNSDSNNNGTSNHIFKESNNELMRITSAGNVGIGTTSPAEKLTVEDKIGIKRSGVSAVTTLQQTGTGLIMNAPNGYHPLVISYNGSEFFRFTNSGNLGIGTTSPSYPLDVNGIINSTGVYVNGHDQISGSRFFEPLAYVDAYTRTTTANSTDEWVKVISVSASPRRIRLALYHGGDNTNAYDEYLISHSSYGMQTHIFRLPGSKYNTSKILGVKAINPTASTQEVWVKVAGVTSSNGTFQYRSNVTVLPNATVSASAQSSEPTSTTGSSVITFDSNDRNAYTTISSGGAKLFGSLWTNSVQAGNYKIDNITILDTSSTYTRLYNPEGAIGLYIGDSGDRSNYYDNNYHYFRTAGGSSVLGAWNSTGLAVGLSSPAQKLHINGNLLFENNKEIRFIDTSATQRTVTRVSSSNELEFGWSGAGAVKFMGGGSYTERMRIHTNGFVGIGEQNPLDLLHISSSTTDARMILDGASGYDAELKFFENGAVKYTIGHDAASGNFVIGTTNVDTSQRFIIESNGNTAIGATTASGNKLYVNGSTLIDGGAYINNGLTAVGQHNFRHDTASTGENTKFFNYTSGGTIQIGFQQNDTDGMHHRAYLRVNKDANGTYGGRMDFLVRQHSTAAQLTALTLRSNGNVEVPNGSVGIGTTTPSSKLTVNTSTAGEGALRLGVLNQEQYVFETGISGVTNGALILKDVSTPYTYMTFRSGNVGINTTSPSEKLHVEGRLRLGTTPVITSHDDITIDIDQNNNQSDRYFRVTKDGESSELFRVQENGNVGIGTATPGYKLDVSGTIRATGDVIAYSDARVKENVKTIDNALDKVTQLRGVSYNKIGETEEKIGVIAQEIEKVLPQVVQEDAEGMKSVAYGNIVGVLIEAIKEQQKQIDELKSRLDGSTK